MSSTRMLFPWWMGFSSSVKSTMYQWGSLDHPVKLLVLLWCVGLGIGRAQNNLYIPSHSETETWQVMPAILWLAQSLNTNDYNQVIDLKSAFWTLVSGFTHLSAGVQGSYTSWGNRFGLKAFGVHPISSPHTPPSLCSSLLWWVARSQYSPA